MGGETNDQKNKTASAWSWKLALVLTVIGLVAFYSGPPASGIPGLLGRAIGILVVVLAIQHVNQIRLENKYESVDTGMGRSGKAMLVILAIGFLVPVGYALVMGPVDASDINTTDVENAIGEEINDKRAQEDLTQLSKDSALRDYAKNHAAAMQSQQEIGLQVGNQDQYRDRFNDYDIPCPVEDAGLRATAYNISSDDSDDIAKFVINDWLERGDSQYATLYPRYEYYGVGVNVTDSGGNTTMYVAATFC